MIDVIFGVLFLYLVLVGAYRGFVELFVKSAGIGIGIFLSFKYTDIFSDFLSHYFKGSPFVIQFFSFSLILITAFSVSFVVYHFLRKIFLKKKRFSFWDKILGASGGVMIFLIIVSIIAHYSEKNRLLYDLTSSSKLVNFLKK
ncbi:CvpA family protein [Persephonella atlantica]|uniref:CvpA family protein n=1 Tax=Persephonella atlantica TaxID=2699429 RepID=A0ABS1GJV6_9AQUI|nr:CvpA family protein [Persephonella atlantica]MBK3333217.1 CvpA family protein [Persephonella atlantica]